MVDFWGVVREMEDGLEIEGIDYEAHQAMAEHQMQLIADAASLAVRERLDPRLGAQPSAQERRAFADAEVGRTAGARVIAVRMGDDGALDGLAGVEVKPARRAMKPLRRIGDHPAMLLQRREVDARSPGRSTQSVRVPTFGR